MTHEWISACERDLLEGASLNIIGLSGSGRSRSLLLLHDHLVAEGWTCLLWTYDDLRLLDRKAMRQVVGELRRSQSIPVLLVDDFGDFLVASGDGPWLERMLFAASEAEPDDGNEYLRCVLVTYPRDREIVGPGSVLRERSRSVAPHRPEPTAAELGFWGVANPTELECLTGGSTSFESVGGSSPHERRGVAAAAMTSLLPRLVGELDGVQQRRLHTIQSRPTPARWRPHESDPSLRPLIVRAVGEDGDECRMSALVEPRHLVPLLLPERWPDRDLEASARRFAARCGNEPAPLWIDNFLSDLKQLDFVRLASFLGRVMKVRGPESRLRMLSRSTVNGNSVDPRSLGIALSQGGLSRDVQAQIEWRLYRRGAVPNLHSRELVLAKRGTGFKLPTATMLVGQVEIANEDDAEITLHRGGPANDAWSSGISVPWS